jgi:poly(A) polymerase
MERFLKEERLNSKLQHIFYLLGLHSPNNYLVGGCVRDGFLGGDIKDYDIVTDVPMDVSRKTLEDYGWKVKECGEAFLVLNVSKDGEQYEIANFRKEGVYLDGRRPANVEIGTIEEDAQRRDFTINALYENPVTGQILDPTGKGLSDIKNRVLRFIGKPKERIKEDYLRVFRFYRFLACKELVSDVKSMKACRQYFNEAYENTTPERVRLEMERMI